MKSPELNDLNLNYCTNLHPGIMSLAFSSGCQVVKSATQGALMGVDLSIGYPLEHHLQDSLFTHKIDVAFLAFCV